jgi:carbamate kinase
MKEKGWKMIEDSSRGFRRVVPSPFSLEIHHSGIIRKMLDIGEIVIALGGGGIPVVRNEDGSLERVEAVINKDLASSRLALEIEADILLILTTLEKVYLNFSSLSRVGLDRIKVSDAIRWVEEGQFGKGSMEPKIRAGIEFLKDQGKISTGRACGARKVIITLPDLALPDLEGHTATCMEV